MKWLILPALLVALLATPRESRSESASAWTQVLQSSLTGISKLRVRSGGTCHRQVDEEKTLLEADDAAAIASLIQHLSIDDQHSGFLFSCICCGNPTLEFFRQGELVGL